MQDLPADRLGPFPILQLAFAILIVGGLAFAIWRANRDRKTGERGSQFSIPNEQLWFFNGPIVEAMNILKDVKNHLSRLVDLHEQKLDEQRETNNYLRDIRNGLNNNDRRR